MATERINDFIPQKAQKGDGIEMELVSWPEIDFTSAGGDAEVADRHTRRGQARPFRDPREQSRG